MALPAGVDEGTSEQAMVESSVRALALVHEEAANISELSSRARSLRHHAELLAEHCNPEANPGSYRLCQAAALPAAPSLLALARLAADKRRASPDHSVRTASLAALTWLCLGNKEAASEVASMESFPVTLEFSLRPVLEIRQQEEHMVALQLMQALAALTPEAPSVAMLLGRVVALLNPEEAGHIVSAPVRLSALGVVLSCAFSQSRRRQVGSLLSEPMARSILEWAGEQRERIEGAAFLVSLMFANICELEVPGSHEQVFADMAMPLWEECGFFPELAAALAASLQGQPWPPNSRSFHSSAKLSATCALLATAGHVDRLKDTVSSLVAVVEARALHDELTAADDALSARRAVVALNEFQYDDQVIALMRDSGASFAEALRLMEAEEPAAVALAESLKS